MRRILLTMLFLCGAAHGAPDAAIKGSLVQSPAMPGPQRAGQEESAAPLSGVTVELRGARGVVASASTDADGGFTVHAAPGSYTVHVNIEGMYPRCPDQAVTLRKGRSANIVLRCDSGMR
jgi:hypothetical protein